MTLRSIFLGAILCAGLCFFAARANISYGYYIGFSDHFNAAGVIFIIFWLPVLAGLFRSVGLGSLISPAEFSVVYAMLMVATVLPTMGFGAYFLPLAAGVHYYATPENRWAETLLPHLPAWIAPSDPSAIVGLFEGIPKDQPIPWAAWQKPLLLWGLFVFGYFLVSMALVVLLRRQWAEHERLTFPLAAIPLEMAQACGGLPSVFRSRALWIGAAIAFLIPFVDAVRLVYGLEDTIPSLSIPAKTFSYRTPVGGVWINFAVDLMMVGLSYLVTLEVLLSVWFFYLLTTWENFFIGWLFPGTGGVPHAAGGMLIGSQQTGALLALLAASLWVGRKSLFRLFCSAFGRNADGEAPAIRWALVSALAGTACLIGFTHAMGLALKWAVLFVFLALALMLGTARVLAQTGLGRVRAPCATPPFMATTLGTATLGPQNMAPLGLGFCWAGDIQLFFIGTCFHALHVAGGVVKKKRRLFLAMGLAMAVATLVTFVTYIGVGSRVGLVNGFGWYFINSPRYHWDWVASSIENPGPASWDSIGFLGGGAAAALVLASLSYRIPGWPVHPVGLAICQINTVQHDWFSIFLAWIIKASLLRFGGGRAYHKARPFFFGLILGACVGIGLKGVWVALAKG